jgi:hypothetical protein
MRFLITLGILCLLGLLFASTADAYAQDIKQGQCVSYAVTGTGSDYYINFNGKTLTVELEADIASDGTGTQVEVNTCTNKQDDANRCEGWYWDHDYNGSKTHNTLTGSAFPTQERQIRIQGTGQLYLNSTVHVDDGEVTVCAVDE